MPSAPVPGNLLLAVVFNNNPITTSPTYTNIENWGTNNPICRSMYRIAQPGEPALQNPVTTSGVSWVIAEFHSDGGFTSLGPIDVHLIVRAASSAPPAVTTGPVTPTAAGEMAFVASCSNGPNGTPQPIPGMTTITTGISGGNLNGTGMAAYQLNVPAGVAYSAACTWVGGSYTASAALVIIYESHQYVQNVVGSLKAAGAQNKQIATGVASGSLGPTSPRLGRRQFFLQLPAGAVSLTGAIQRGISAVFGGSSAPGGGILRLLATGRAGRITPVGGLGRMLAQAFVGSIAVLSSGLQRQTSALLRGQITPAGTLGRAVQYVVALPGSIAVAGTLATQFFFNRFFSGSVTPAGTLGRGFTQALLDSLAPAGALVRLTKKRLFPGGITPAGALLYGRQLFQVLVGSIALTGTLAMHQAFTRALASAITLTGALRAGVVFGVVLDGALAATGRLAKMAVVGLGGSIPPRGALRRAFTALLEGSIAVGGTMGRRSTRALLTGYLQVQGEVRRAFAVVVAGSIRARSAMGVRSVVHLLTGQIPLRGALRRGLSAVGFGSIIGPQSAFARRRVARKVSASIIASDSLGRTLSVRLQSAVRALGSVVRRVGKVVAGAIGLRGTFPRPVLGIPLAGSIMPTGALTHARSILLADSIALQSALGTPFIGANLASTIRPVGTLTGYIVQRGSLTLPVYGACGGLLVPTWRTNILSADPVALLTAGLPSGMLYDAEPTAVMTTAIVTV